MEEVEVVALCEEIVNEYDAINEEKDAALLQMDSTISELESKISDMHENMNEKDSYIGILIATQEKLQRDIQRKEEALVNLKLKHKEDKNKAAIEISTLQQNCKDYLGQINDLNSLCSFLQSTPDSPVLLEMGSHSSAENVTIESGKHSSFSPDVLKTPGKSVVRENINVDKTEFSGGSEKNYHSRPPPSTDTPPSYLTKSELQKNSPPYSTTPDIPPLPAPSGHTPSSRNPATDTSTTDDIVTTAAVRNAERADTPTVNPSNSFSSFITSKFRSSPGSSSSTNGTPPVHPTVTRRHSKNTVVPLVMNLCGDTHDSPPAVVHVQDDQTHCRQSEHNPSSSAHVNLFSTSHATNAGVENDLADQSNSSYYTKRGAVNMEKKVDNSWSKNKVSSFDESEDIWIVEES